MASELVGLLLIDKPVGPTSHDVVAQARRGLGIRRIGHTGTLDPFASGLLILCVGYATRVAEYVSALPKLYRGVMRLGERTDTDDRTGEVIATEEGWQGVDRGRLESALAEQRGELEQRPPAYSARRVGGVRAHALARAGERPRLQPRKVNVGRLEVLRFQPPEVEFEIECSSGTYVRAVARDVGESLGVGAHLTALRRLEIGSFSVADAIRLSPETTRDRLVDSVRPPGEAVAHLPRLDLDRAALTTLRNGQPVSVQDDRNADPVAVFVDGRLAAIGRSQGGRVWPAKVLVSP